LPTDLEKIKDNKFFLFCLLATGFAVLISNIAGKEIANVTTDLIYIPVSGGLLVLSLIIVAKFRWNGDHGKAYLLFAGFASFWFTAEILWFRAEFVYHLLPFPEDIDWLYLAGYPFLFAFTIYYLKPFWIAISRKMFSYAALATLVFLVPTLYTMHSYNPDATLPEMIWGALYPIADAMVLFPAVLGMTLFFKGQVSLFWSLCCIAIILNIVADSGVFFLDIDTTAYSGNPINILYLWSYLLFAFGINSHVKIFKIPKMKSYDNVDDLK
jgi:hypothetical protein